MQSLESQEIIKRFFHALSALKARKIIHGKQTFTRRYDIDNRNFFRLEKDITSDIFQVAWLSYLVKDYDISPAWLLTGQGDIFVEGLEMSKNSKEIEGKNRNIKEKIEMSNKN